MNKRVKLASKKPEAKSENLISHEKKTDLYQSKSSPVEKIMFLQRTIGNHAVQRLIKSRTLHAKLRIGQPGDVYEQEADRVAEQVMRIPDISGRAKDTRIQRKCPKCEEKLRRQPEEGKEILQTQKLSNRTPDITPELESRINALKGGGQPLPESVRAFFGPRFGYDFSHVRVHTDSRAAESAREVNALSYTVGREVVFGTDQYAPWTHSGKKLLAHELAHVVQQSERGISGSNLAPGEVSILHEREAGSVSARPGDTAMETSATLAVQGLKQAHAPTLQRLGPAAAVAAGAAAGAVIGAMTFEAALNYAKSLSTRYPGWLSTLPNCPCTETKVRSAPGNWESDQNPLLSWFHPGAATSYRSKSTFSSVPGSAHGQQCTYDSSGGLITEGPGAGTPDVWSPTTNTANHLLYDAATWQVLGWRIYTSYWVPNNGNACPANRGEYTLGRRFSEFMP